MPTESARRETARGPQPAPLAPNTLVQFLRARPARVTDQKAPKKLMEEPARTVKKDPHPKGTKPKKKENKGVG